MDMWVIQGRLLKDKRVALSLATEFGYALREEHPIVKSVEDIPVKDADIARHFIQSLQANTNGKAISRLSEVPENPLRTPPSAGPSGPAPPDLHEKHPGLAVMQLTFIFEP